MASFLGQIGNVLGSIGQTAQGLDDWAYQQGIGQYAPPNVYSNGADVGAYNQALEGAYAPYNSMMSRRGELLKRREERAAEMEKKRRFQGALGNVMRTGGFAGPLEPYSDILMTAQSPEEFAALGKVFQGLEPQTTANIREYQLAQKDPKFAEYIKERGARDATGTEAIVSSLMDEDPNLSYYEALSLAQGLARKGLNIQGGRVTPMAGAPEALGTLAEGEAAGEVRGSGKITDVQKRKNELQDAKIKTENALNIAISGAQNINTVIDEALSQANNWTTGIGTLFNVVPGTPASNLEANLKTIQADSAFSALQQMRDASPTGGALGQVSERELSLLSAARASLEQSQSPEQFKKNLQRYKEVRETALNNAKKAYKNQFGVDFGGKPTGRISAEQFLQGG